MDNRKVMVFVDGTNFLIQLGKYLEITYKPMKPPKSTISLANHFIHRRIADYDPDNILLRRYWFASYQGNDEDKYEYIEILRNNNFEPMLYKNNEKRQEKGVDIGLAKEMLVNAFNQNYDIGYLIAGDKDYLELVSEVKRYGPNIYGAFFEEGLSPELKLAFDHYSSFDHQAKFPNKIAETKESIKSESE